MRGLLFALLGSAVIVAASCSVYDSSLYQNSATNGGSAGHTGGSGNGGGGNGADGSVGGSGNNASYCEGAPRATYPDPPTGVPSSSKNVEIVTAQFTIDLGDSPKAPIEPTHYLDIGFDLDNTCTLLANPKEGQCRPPSYAVGVVDGKGGIDNALGKLIQTVRDQIADFSSGNYSKRLQEGKSNVLLHLENWNGEANDDSVVVSTMVAAPFNSFVSTAKPTWQGDDAWPVASDSVNNDSVKTPKFVDKNAYVTNYQLVATLSDADLRLDVGLTSVQDVKLDLKLSGASILCTIVPTEEGKWGYTFSKCTLGGRWLADNLVQQLGQFPNPLDNNRPLCKGNNSYEAFKLGICTQLDMFHGTSTPTTPCDSLSIGITYTTKPALLGDVFHLKPIPDPCCQPPGCVPGSRDDYDHNPKYDCCDSIDAPDAGKFAACGANPPAIDAGSSGSGGAGTGGAATGGRGGTGGGSSGGASSGGGGTSNGGKDGGAKDASANG